MKTSIVVAALLAAAFAVGLASAQTPVPAPVARRAWEYRCEVLEGAMTNSGIAKKLTETLNASGKDGWELVAFAGNSACYKRPN